MIFVLVFLLYWWTLCPGLYVGDTGELLAAADCLGIPHPTGYPLYLLLVKATDPLLPGSLAHSANLLSALCAAAAAQLAASAFARLLGNVWIARGAALLLAGLEPIWSQATVARTYPLALLFSAGLLWLAVRWWQDPRPRWFLLHNLVLGFGLANHPMVLAHIPAFLALILLRRDGPLYRGGTAEQRGARRRSWMALGLSALLLLPGLGLYSYLPIRAAADPSIEYLAPEVSEDGKTTLSGLDEIGPLFSYLRRDYLHGHHWAEGIGDQVHILGYHLKLVGIELWYLGLLPLVAGVFALSRPGWRPWLAFGVALWLGTLGPLALHGAYWDIFLYPRYMTTGWLAVALGVAAGSSLLVERLQARRPWRGWPLVVAGVLPALVIALNHARCDRSEHRLAEDYARALLAELPEGAQYGSAADNSIFPLMYLQVVEGEREDVRLVNEVQMPGSKPDYTRPLYSADLSAGPYSLYRTSQRIGLCTVFTADGSTVPTPDLEEAEIWGLGGEGPLDLISASVVSQIHADYAEAHRLRGENAACRRHLDRVLELPLGRGWGDVRAAEISLTLAKLALQEGFKGQPRDPARTRSDLDRARHLARRLDEEGDPKDGTGELLLGLCRAFGEVHDALEARDAGDRPGHLAGIESAARRHPSQSWIQHYYLFLLPPEQKEAHRAWLRQLGLEPPR